MKTRILYAKPSITDLEVEYATDAVRNGWGERCYDYINRFEAAFRDCTGAHFALATSSATGALHMGLAALGIGPGTEVILAETNWVATVSAVHHLGAVPVFVDILPDTWCLDPEGVAAAITDRTRAIIAVHLYGNVCALERLRALGAQHGIPVIEDAAEALGSKWKGQQVGSFGTFGVFSFHGTKTITTGEGGMLVTSDAALYEKALTLSNHGRRVGERRQFWPEVIGFKYKLSNVQAAIGCAQMARLTELVARKREIFLYYQAALQQLPGVCFNPEPPNTFNSYWMPTIIFPAQHRGIRDRLLEALRMESIDGRCVFYPLSRLPMFKEQPEHIHAYALSSRGINLPSYHDMTVQDQDRVIEVVRRAYAQGS